MTGPEAADAMRRLADVVQRYEHMPKIKAQMDENCQVGAAAMLAYIRDLFTGGAKEQFSRDEVLVLLNVIQNDPKSSRWTWRTSWRATTCRWRTDVY